MNFDFDIDLNFEEQPTMSAIIQKSKSKKRLMFKIDNEVKQLEKVLPNLPTENEVFKMLSVKGGFSSIGIIQYIAEKEPIQKLYVSTFRIGLKQFAMLKDLKESELLNDVEFITSGMQGLNGLKYDYLSPILNGCKEYGWSVTEINNHSKLILAKTKNNYYVIETSSNLNENPKIEQFSFENDRKIFEWYVEFFEAVKKI